MDGMISQADHLAAIAAARTDATALERQRITAILNCEAAAGRQAAALSMALAGDISAETAAGVLATIAVEKPQAAPPSFKLDGARSKDSPGGLAVVETGGPSAAADLGPSSDFDKGRAIAKSMRDARGA